MNTSKYIFTGGEKPESSQFLFLSLQQMSHQMLNTYIEFTHAFYGAVSTSSYSTKESFGVAIPTPMKDWQITTKTFTQLNSTISNILSIGDATQEKTSSLFSNVFEKL